MLDSIQIITAFNFLLFAFFILYNRKKIDVAIVIFSFFLLGKGLTLFGNLALGQPLSSNSNLIYAIGIILKSFLFFYAPFLYIFSLTLTKGILSFKDFRFHFIPFFIFTLLSIVPAIFFLLEKRNSFVGDIVILRSGFQKLYHIQVFAYTLFSFFIIQKHQNRNDKFLKISSWIKKVLGMFLLIWMLFLAGAMPERFAIPMTLLNTIGVFLLFLLSNIILLMLLNSPEYFYNNLLPKLPSKINKDIITKRNYDNLCELVFEQKIYKKSNLKIGDLSELIGLSSRNTSVLIHTFFEGNFYDFINYYRIEEAKLLLKNEDRDITILEILYEVGFNSKSVFNTVFKKVVGQTPSSYRKDQITIKPSVF